MNNQTSILNDAELNIVSGGNRWPNENLSHLNTNTSMILNEANDGEARAAALIKAYGGLLQDLRKKF